MRSVSGDNFLHLVSVTLSHINGITIVHFKSVKIWLQFSCPICFFQCHVVEKVFQNLRMRLKLRIR